uniref:Uncharacterized protein n=1 Tax=Rhizophora mucronata TaxID=61149 RepID=A0A2P2QM19_RHIMU
MHKLPLLNLQLKKSLAFIYCTSSKQNEKYWRKLMIS